MDELSKDLKTLCDTAIEAAKIGGNVLRKGFRSGLEITEKKDAGWVTEFDIRSEKKIIEYLSAKTPYSFLAEESGETRLSDTCQDQWIIDPLDGTTNYARGLPIFAVSIGLKLMGKLQVGVVFNPITDEFFYAYKGGGAFLNGERIFVTKTDTIEKSVLSTGFSTARAQRQNIDTFRVFEKAVKTAFAVRRPGAAALDLAYTAAGVFDGYWELGLSPWDMAAGIVILREAGGIITDFSNQEHDGFQQNIVASNSIIHSDLIDIIRNNS